MKKSYCEAELEIVKFTASDIITESTCVAERCEGECGAETCLDEFS